VPGVGEIADVEGVPAVVDTHLGKLGVHRTSTTSCRSTVRGVWAVYRAR
jgi:hypothetical protein